MIKRIADSFNQKASRIQEYSLISAMAMPFLLTAVYNGPVISTAIAIIAFGMARLADLKGQSAIREECDKAIISEKQLQNYSKRHYELLLQYHQAQADFEILKEKMNVPDAVLYISNLQGEVALPCSNKVFMTMQTLHLDREERKFILAHELAHIKNKDHQDDLRHSCALYASGMGAASHACVALLSGEMVGALLMAGISHTLLAVLVIIPNARMRVQEFRADREAITQTRNPDAAKRAILSYEGIPSTGKTKQRLEQLFLSSHPVGYWRAKHLDKINDRLTRREQNQKLKIG